MELFVSWGHKDIVFVAYNPQLGINSYGINSYAQKSSLQAAKCVMFNTKIRVYRLCWARFIFLTQKSVSFVPKYRKIK